MTCVVAIKEGKNVWMGADSMASTEDLKSNLVQPKIFKNGNILIGCCGSTRMLQLLQYYFKAPKHSRGVEDNAYLACDFMSSVRVCFTENGFLGDPGADSTDKSDTSGEFLVAYKGKIYYAQDDFSIIETTDSYASVGSGNHLAFGSLHSTESFNLSPKERIEMAIQAATYHCPSVGGPINIFKL